MSEIDCLQLVRRGGWECACGPPPMGGFGAPRIPKLPKPPIPQCVPCNTCTNVDNSKQLCGGHLKVCKAGLTKIGCREHPTDLNGPTNIKVKGQYAYITTECTPALTVVDVSNPKELTILHSEPMPVHPNPPLEYAGLRDCAMCGDKIYILTSDDETCHGLIIYDITIPTDPQICGFNPELFLGDSFPTAIDVCGNIAYINTASSGFHAINITDPQDIKKIGKIDFNTPGPIGSGQVVVRGRYAYILLGGDNSFHIIDIKDPSTMVHVSGTRHHLRNPKRLVIKNNLAYITSKNNGSLNIYNIADPYNITLIGFTSSHLNKPMDLYVFGNKVCIVSDVSNNKLHIFDVSDPTNIKYCSSFCDCCLSHPFRMDVCGNTLFLIEHFHDRLYSIDIGGSFLQTLEAGNVKIDDLHVKCDVCISGNLDVCCVCAKKIRVGELISDIVDTKQLFGCEVCVEKVKASVICADDLKVLNNLEVFNQTTTNLCVTDTAKTKLGTVPGVLYVQLGDIKITAPTDTSPTDPEVPLTPTTGTDFTGSLTLPVGCLEAGRHLRGKFGGVLSGNSGSFNIRLYLINDTSPTDSVLITSFSVTDPDISTVLLWNLCFNATMRPDSSLEIVNTTLFSIQQGVTQNVYQFPTDPVPIDPSATYRFAIHIQFGLGMDYIISRLGVLEFL